MKLLVVTQYFWPENFRINDLVAELVSRGHEVTVLTGKPNYPDGVVFPEFAKTPGKFSRFGGAKIVRVPMLPRGKGGLRLMLNYLSFAMSGSLIGPLLLRKQAFDAIFICQLSPVTIALPGIVMRWLRRIPSVHWVLDLWPQSLEAVGAVKSRFILALLDRLVGAIYRQSDVVLAQSHSFVAEIDRYLPKSRRASYFPSWSEPIAVKGASVPAPEVPGKKGSFDIVFAGNIGDAQDFPAILDAAELLRDHPVRWLVVGDGRKASWVREEIERRQLAGVVLMLGRYPLERMPSFFRHANALLVSLADRPAFAMTIPGKLQSYLATGIPVLAMLNGEGASVVGASGAGFAVAAGDSAGLAKAVIALSEASPLEREQMGQQGQDYSVREFSRATLISQLEGWLEELSAEAKRNGGRRGKRLG